MASVFAFRCTCCGKIHEGSPSFGYSAPWHYSSLSAEDRAKAELTSDTCVISYAEGVDRFIRVVVEVPIHGAQQPFTWGVWVSLSESSFNRYVQHWDNPDEDASYFGWFCNRLPYYEDTMGLKTHVRPRKGGIRPHLEIEGGGHTLAEHVHNGITVALAQEIAEKVMHGG